ncbi:unnamed protein product [Adineta ricciae]|uniref:Uncharacterized protein n=1 Tax=Adineta ricciae TaxID=249248 RepID=A0A815MDG6_ADIRI|nr:unnamed protein product [Adineta ricciae]
MRWLFLESGHSKDIADGLGSVIKRLFDNVIRLNPDESFKGAKKLMNKIINSTNIRLYFYKKEDSDALRERIPPLTTIKGTSMFHEIIAKPNGEVFIKQKSVEPEILLKTNF